MIVVVVVALVVLVVARGLRSRRARKSASAVVADALGQRRLPFEPAVYTHRKRPGSWR